MKRTFFTTCLMLGVSGYSMNVFAAGAEWSGFYGGLNVGGVWGHAVVTDNAADGVNPGPFSYSPAGMFGSGSAGYSWQGGPVVFGFEADLGYMGLSGSGIIGSAHADHHQDITLRSGAYGDVTARLGYAFGQTLLYSKGGLAFYAGEAKQATTNPGYAPTGTDVFRGWTIGAGFEHFVTPSMSVKVEYQHFDFGKQSGYQTALADDWPTPAGYRFYNWTSVTADSVKVGVNWHLPSR